MRKPYNVVAACYGYLTGGRSAQLMVLISFLSHTLCSVVRLVLVIRRAVPSKLVFARRVVLIFVN